MVCRRAEIVELFVIIGAACDFDVRHPAVGSSVHVAVVHQEETDDHEDEEDDDESGVFAKVFDHGA